MLGSNPPPAPPWEGGGSGGCFTVILEFISYIPICLRNLNKKWLGKKDALCKGTVRVIYSDLTAKVAMPDSQRYPWNLYQIHNVKDIVVFLGLKMLTSDNFKILIIEI